MADEAAVELELVDGQRPQVGQRGVAGAVVVHRQPHAQPAQAGHDLLAAGGVGHEHVLGDLQDQRRRGHPEAGQQHLDLVGQRDVLEVGHRQVHRDRQVVAAAPPLPQVARASAPAPAARAAA